MHQARNRGRLKQWNDDRGFGFITPEGGGSDVFLHISALPELSRRPRVGDTIVYKLGRNPQGKLQAENASIEGVVVPSSPTRSQSSSRKVSRPSSPKNKSQLITLGESLLTLVIMTCVGLVAYKAIRTASLQTLSSDVPSSNSNRIVDAINPNCVVKGNISISTGKKLYHVPGMEDYINTEIDMEKGERWFCSEAEAQQAGWTRAPR